MSAMSLMHPVRRAFDALGTLRTEQLSSEVKEASMRAPRFHVLTS